MFDGSEHSSKSQEAALDSVICIDTPPPATGEHSSAPANTALGASQRAAPANELAPSVTRTAGGPTLPLSRGSPPLSGIGFSEGGASVRAQSDSSSVKLSGGGPTYTRADVSRIASQEGRPLIIVSNAVLDVGAFAASHPGGPDVFSMYFGRDATMAVESTGHSPHAWATMRKYRVGTLILTECVGTMMP